MTFGERWGEKDKIIKFWLDYKPMEWSSIRHVFYMNINLIESLVPQHIKDRYPKWAFTFYLKMSSYLSDIFKNGYTDIYRVKKILPDDAVESYIYQNFIGKRDHIPPDNECQPDYPSIEIWVEKNSIFNAVAGFFAWHNPNRICKLNVVSGHGWCKSQQIGEMLLDRKEVKTILYLTDFDPAGDQMVEDLQRRMGQQINVRRIALFPEQIPLSRRKISIWKPKPSDKKLKKFYEKYGKNQMCYELDCLKGSELVNIILKALKEEIRNLNP